MKVFVVGAGTMGVGIAQCFAMAGNDVDVYDISTEIIESASKRLAKTFGRLVEKQKITPEYADSLTKRIRFTTELESASGAALVIEAIVEDAAKKKKVFAALDSICGEDAIFATNTSSISITEIASAVKRKDKFIGMHFFNPAATMKLVELIKGSATSDETFEKVWQISLDIDKSPILVNEAPGFVVNRILIPMINEAVCILNEGVASASDIDAAMKLGANHPMGPLALADLIGVDVCLAIMDTLYNETHDPKYRANIMLRRMVRAGELGKKTGKGFFDYTR